MTPIDRSTRAEYLVIESMRGLAAAMVLYTHFWAFSDNDIRFFRFTHTGVDLFFLLSGYVFGPYFFGKDLHLVAFWLRRFFRIYPLFVLALAIYMVQKQLQGHQLLYIFEHLSFSFLQSKAMAFYYNPPFWSLPAEVEFYLLLPIVAILMRAWPVLGPCLLVLALSLRGLLGYLADFSNENHSYLLLHHLPGLAIEFSIGIVLWRLIRNVEADRKPSILFIAGLPLAGIIGWSALAWHFALVGDAGVNASFLRGQMGLLAALCYALVLAGILLSIRHRAAAAAISTDRHRSTHSGIRHWVEGIAIWGGKLSYGTYLFHMAALNMMLSLESSFSTIPLYDRALWATLLTIFGAALAHILYEDPLRKLGRSIAAWFERKPFRRRRYPLA